MGGAVRVELARAASQREPCLAKVFVLLGAHLWRALVNDRLFGIVLRHPRNEQLRGTLDVVLVTILKFLIGRVQHAADLSIHSLRLVQLLKIIAQHRKASFEYEIIDTYEAGIVLTGTEIKSLRRGNAVIRDGHISIREDEAWVHNLNIPEYSHGNRENHIPMRKRKLLLHHREIERIRRKISQQGFSAFPIKLYFKGHRVKLARNFTLELFAIIRTVKTKMGVKANIETQFSQSRYSSNCTVTQSDA